MKTKQLLVVVIINSLIVSLNAMSSEKGRSVGSLYVGSKVINGKTTGAKEDMTAAFTNALEAKLNAFVQSAEGKQRAREAQMVDAFAGVKIEDK